MNRAIATAVLAVVALLSGACSRGSGLDPDGAVELLVLDGLERGEAECLVAEIGDRLDLTEVTGMGGDLDTEELAILFEASRGCQPASPASSSGVVGGTLEELNDLGESEEVEALDVEGVVAELLRGGLDPEMAVCVAATLLSSADPVVAVDDDARKVDAVAACQQG